MATAGARTASVACRGRGRGGSFGGKAHNAEAASDQSADGLACLRMVGESRIFHGVLDFELNGLLGRLGGNGFIDIGGHGLGLAERGDLKRGDLVGERCYELIYAGTSGT